MVTILNMPSVRAYQWYTRAEGAHTRSTSNIRQFDVSGTPAIIQRLLCSKHVCVSLSVANRRNRFVAFIIMPIHSITFITYYKISKSCPSAATVPSLEPGFIFTGANLG